MTPIDPGRPPAHNGDRPEDFVQSVSRALRVLEIVSTTAGLPVKAIARRADLNISTTYHLVRTMAYEGYLRRDADGTYSLGDQVARRFHDLLASLERPPEAHLVLEHLTARTGLSSYLGRLNSGVVTVVDVVEGPRSPYLEDFEVGLDVSAHATALGKALLADLDRRRRRAYLAGQGLRRFTANTCTDLEALESSLAQVPRGAPVVEHGEFRDDVACAAAVVPGVDPASPWALVMSVHGDDVPAAACAELMLAAHDLAGTRG